MCVFIGYKIFDVKPIKGKRASVLAKRELQMGELIVAESPIFTLPYDRDQKTIMAGLTTCNTELKRIFYTMSNCHPETEKMTLELGTFATNCIPCGTDCSSGRVADREGVFVIAARMNHSCVPNLHGSWVDWVVQMEHRATRKIKRSEEMCRSYIDLLQTREARQKQLASRWFFICKCEACSLEGAALEASDRRRTTLKNLLTKHSDGQCTDAEQGLAEVSDASGPAWVVDIDTC